MTNTKSNNKGSTNDGLALIIGGLFVLALVFATYSYFNRSPSLGDDVQSASSERSEDDKDDTTSLGDRIKELFNSSSDKDGLNGKIADSQKDDIVFDETLGKGGPKVLYSVWTANDYQLGDVTGTSYVVKAGDTLWEIAEAKYGSGADWTKILQANAGGVGYLPNGQQALITVGQTLVLP